MSAPVWTSPSDYVELTYVVLRASTTGEDQADVPRVIVRSRDSLTRMGHNRIYNWETVPDSLIVEDDMELLKRVAAFLAKKMSTGASP